MGLATCINHVFEKRSMAIITREGSERTVEECSEKCGPVPRPLRTPSGSLVSLRSQSGSVKGN